eukprot:3993362-Amphidinium_carterae.1
MENKVWSRSGGCRRLHSWYSQAVRRLQGSLARWSSQAGFRPRVNGGREEGAHAVPGHLCECVLPLKTNCAPHPGLNIDVEPVLLVMAVGPAKRPIPELRTLNRAVSSFGIRREDASRTEYAESRIQLLGCWYTPSKAALEPMPQAA